jgi:hypothetical protein
MTTTGLKYTFAEHCAHAMRFVSSATGVVADFDLPERFHWDPPTSDPVSNVVDVYSFDFDEVTGVVIVPTHLPLLPAHLWPPPAPTLSQLAHRLRDLAGLPVADLAAMIGIGRRQFYNLLDHGSTSAETELRVRHLADQLERIAGVVGDNPVAVRSALLTPVGSPARTLYEVALAGEDSKLGETFDALIDRIERRGLRQVPRALPRRRPGGGGETEGARAQEALEELPSLELGAEETSDEH